MSISNYQFRHNFEPFGQILAPALQHVPRSVSFVFGLLREDRPATGGTRAPSAGKPSRRDVAGSRRGESPFNTRSPHSPADGPNSTGVTGDPQRNLCALCRRSPQGRHPFRAREGLVLLPLGGWREEDATIQAPEVASSKPPPRLSDRPQDRRLRRGVG